jgi:hypothetical protein
MAAARGASALAPSLAAAIDLSLLFVAFFGLEIGGLFLVPAVLSFLVADLLEPGLPGRKTP